ncbi:protein VraC [Staphylococcus hominis]|uniref:Protein VraC n=1 Tax=Staphylococcus hominis TaxID=1290 RepID=A0A974KW26_STAHO|nr:protein VraC [Staphylococcus hominis]PTK29495.1 protein VraC [Staphylococcus hominis]PTK36533.1 protein VraC [Staphylococcus hominis]RIO59148.1 protein VraC [Staphylococcus hominis]
MRYSSNDGAYEKIEIDFNEQEVRAYCEVVERTYKGVVPPLMCANVWPKFKLFQKFQQEHILLVRTTCEEFESLKCRLKYEAYLTHKSTKKFKTYIQYIYDLKIYKDNRQCIFIRQTFIKKEVNDEV